MVFTENNNNAEIDNGKLSDSATNVISADDSDTLGVIDIQKIKTVLPHRYPFLLVDRVTKLVPGKYALGYKNVSINESFFQGHFEEKPILPGVLIVEAMAQISGVLGFYTKGSRAESGVGYLLVGINGIRFKTQVVPGDQLMLESRLVSRKRGVWKFDTKAMVDDQLVTEAQLLVVEKEFDT